MTDVVWTFVGSSAGLVGLMLLFYVEARRSQRVFEPVRRRLDALVDWVIVRWHTTMLYVGGGAARVGLHYVLHHVFAWARVATQWLEYTLRSLQRRNRRIARTVQAVRTESHLTAIAEHKHLTALSEDEKETLKEKSLAG